MSKHRSSFIHNTWFARVLVVCLLVMLIGQPSSFILAQQETPATKGADATNDSEKTAADAYAEIVAKAKTQKGVINVHQVDQKWYLEIPANLLGREFFWYAELTEMPANYVPAGTGLEVASRMVKLERVNDTIFVRDLTEPLQKRQTLPTTPGDQPAAPSDQPAAPSDQPTTPSDQPAAPTEPSNAGDGVNPVRIALEKFALPPALAALPIAAQSPEGALVVDVTQVFADDLPDFSAKQGLAFGQIKAISLASDRSYIQSIHTFSRNVEISSFLTFATMGDVSSASVVLHHSITLLPEKPMMPRYFDPRIGYFTTGYDDYSGSDTYSVSSRELINRYRLEKKDPNAALSEPVNPIVYYIGRGWPDKWRPYVKQAVEDWQVAFEAAGFKNAIIAKDAPSEAEDPDWDPADTRYSVIRWVEQPVANAMGPSIIDPRSGEILSAHVLIWSNVFDLAEQWYFSQASAIDKTAQKLPLPEALMGRLLRYIVGHEVGHSLGLRHNHRASQVFTIDQLRDPTFTDKYGTAPSIMSYGRFNYIAQPGDGVTNIVPQIGPYDIFAIQWGYTPIPAAKSPAAEIPTLHEWAARQLKEPFLAFGGEDNASRVDPNVLTENLGSDRIEATRLGIQNLEQVMTYIVTATTTSGSDFSKLKETYNTVLGQRSQWLGSVLKVVGGVEETRSLAGLGGDEFSRVPRARQEAAVAFILENLRTPKPFLAPAVLNNISPFGVLTTLSDQQSALLEGLMTGARYNRLAEQAVLDPTNAYPLVDYLGAIQAGLFEELKNETPQIDPLRRQLQRHYLSILIQQLAAFERDSANPLLAALGSDPTLKFLFSNGEGTDLRAAAHYNLTQLAAEIKAAAPKATDATTQAHLADLLDTIDNILSGRIFMYDSGKSDLSSLLGG